MTTDWESHFVNFFLTTQHDQSDAAHDITHFRRVAKTAEKIAKLDQAQADSLILLAAAYFHDVVSLPKNHPERHLASQYAAKMATHVLKEMQFPSDKIDGVHHAIHAHSYSANIQPQTLEAKIIQDADRIEALGALGIMRAFYIAGRIGSNPYHPEDILAKQRPFDEQSYALDHVFCKLLKLKDFFHTSGGRQLAQERTDFLHLFVNHLTDDISSKKEAGAHHLLDACYQAGAKGRRLFHEEDPFANNRARSPEEFAVDHLIAHRDKPFLKLFFHQLAGELY